MSDAPPARLPLLVIVGPTASGKSELAIQLAELVGGEVLNADSVQIYRGFDIGSGKPTASERARAPHHLFDVADPLDPWEASRFAEEAHRKILDILGRGQLPVLCGGTFLWVKAVLFGLAEAPAGQPELRAAHERFVQEHGRQALHERLAQVDPASAQRLHPHDTLRVSRALEVYELSGKPLSSFHAEHGFRESRYEFQLVGLEWPRELHHARITSRVETMFAQGWLSEVEQLLAAGYGAARAMSAVGYKQIAQALSETPAPELPELIASISQVTRVFARRQRTWLREQAVHWLPPEILSQPEQLAAFWTQLLSTAPQFSELLSRSSPHARAH